MSTLQELLVVLEGVNHDAERFSAQLAQQAQRLGQAAAQAVAVTRQTSRTDGGQAAAALQSAQRATSQAAQQLHQAALVGRQFVSHHSGGGPAAGGAASAGTTDGDGAPALNDADIAALGDYTGTGFSTINESLRGGAPMTNNTGQRAAAVSEALSKLPDRSGPVFRGTTLTPEQIASYVPGAVHPEPGFTSTSSDAKSAFPGNTLFLVISKHGKDVSPYSQYAESEVLFDRGTEFFVTSNFYSQHEGKQVIIMMEV